MTVIVAGLAFLQSLHVKGDIYPPPPPTNTNTQVAWTNPWHAEAKFVFVFLTNSAKTNPTLRAQSKSNWTYMYRTDGVPNLMVRTTLQHRAAEIRAAIDSVSNLSGYVP